MERRVKFGWGHKPQPFLLRFVMENGRNKSR